MATELKTVIDKVDAIKPNSYTTAEKAAWVSELDTDIYNQLTEWYEQYNIINTVWFNWYKRAGGDYAALPYDTDRDYRDSVQPYVDGGTLKYPAGSLIVPLLYDPTGAIYVTWLSIKIDYANGDIAKYNNGKMMFDEQYGAFMNWVNRRLVHKQTRISYIQ